MKIRLKTRKTATRRFALTGTGKVIRGKTGLNHLMSKKSGAQRRNLTAGDVLYKGDNKRIRRMLGERA